MIDKKRKRTRRYRYAVGYMIEQEGSGIVERLVRDGTFTRFGITENMIPGSTLQSLNRTDAEKILRKQEWKFWNYDKIDALTIPAKIFDSHILFDPKTAILLAQQSLNDSGFDLDETERLDKSTRKAIQSVDENNFFPTYIERLEIYGQDEYGTRKSLMRRIRNLPYKNVDTSTTTI